MITGAKMSYLRYATPAFEIIAYTYEADYHCIDCTRKRFGTESITNTYEDQGVKDNEGNLIHPVFVSDETRAGTACGNCYEIIYKYQDNPCVECINLNEYELNPNDGVYDTDCHTVSSPNEANINVLQLCENHYFNQCLNCSTKCYQCGSPGNYAVRDNWYCYNCADELFTICIVYECDCKGEEHSAIIFDERTEEFKEKGFILPSKKCILG